MNDKIARVEDLVNSGCESRHQLTQHIFVCDKFKTCPCAELCLNRDNEFTPEEAAGLLATYQSLKTFVETNAPNVTISDLPE